MQLKCFWICLIFQTIKRKHVCKHHDDVMQYNIYVRLLKALIYWHGYTRKHGSTQFEGGSFERNSSLVEMYIIVYMLLKQGGAHLALLEVWTEIQIICPYWWAGAFHLGNSDRFSLLLPPVNNSLTRLTPQKKERNNTVSYWRVLRVDVFSKKLYCADWCSCQFSINLL